MKRAFQITTDSSFSTVTHPGFKDLKSRRNINQTIIRHHIRDLLNYGAYRVCFHSKQRSVNQSQTIISLTNVFLDFFKWFANLWRRDQFLKHRFKSYMSVLTFRGLKCQSSSALGAFLQMYWLMGEIYSLEFAKITLSKVTWDASQYRQQRYYCLHLN